MDANHTTQYYPNKQVKRRRTSSMRTIYGSEDARRLRWCRPTGLQASLPCVVVAKSRTQQFRHPGHFGLTSTGNAVTLGLGMCSQSAPPICIAASQLRRVRVTYNKLTLMSPIPPPVPPNTHFSSCRSITARTVRPVRDPAYAVAFTSAVAIGGAGSVHRRTGMRTARALSGDRNRPGSTPATDCRQDPPPALPAIQTRCFADHHPMVAHRPTWPCDAGPDVRRPVGAFMMGGARAARSTPHNTASTQTRPYRKHPAGACRRTGGAK